MDLKNKYAKGGEFKEDTPKIYVADLKSYNEGKLIGEWVDLTEYDSGEEVQDKIASLMKEYSKKYHNGEETEHSIHDYENFDSSLYSEYMGEADYDIIIDTRKISEEKGIPAEVLQSISNDFSPDNLEEFVDERYIGEYEGDYELGENYVDNVGGIEGVKNSEFYFDYEALGRDLSINDYNEYDGHYFQNYKKGGKVKEYDLSTYEKGGKTISREDIVEVLKDELEDVLEDANQEYQGQDIKGEEVEYKSRDGFIPFTDGGYEYRFFTYGNYLTGSGKSLPTNTLDAELERVENLNYEYGKERFTEEYPEIVKELGEENIDYNSLSEAGYDSEADDLDEFSRSDDDSIMFEVEAFYYNPDNSRGIDGKHTIVLTGNVNMEAPYHRTGNMEDYTQDKFTFDSIEDLKEKLQKGIDKISKWFDGDNYKEGRELKIGRFAKGGLVEKIKKQAKAKNKRTGNTYLVIQRVDDKDEVAYIEDIDFSNDLTGKYDNWEVIDIYRTDYDYAKGGVTEKDQQAIIQEGTEIEYVDKDGDYVADIGYRNFYGQSRYYIMFNAKMVHSSKTYKSMLRKLNQLKEDYKLEYGGAKYAKGGKLKGFIKVSELKEYLLKDDANKNESYKTLNGDKYVKVSSLRTYMKNDEDYGISDYLNKVSPESEEGDENYAKGGETEEDTWTDNEMQDLLEDIGYEIDDDNLGENAINEGFYWDSDTNVWKNKNQSFAKGGATNDVIMIEIGGDKKYPYYIKKIDTTHIAMANNKDGVDLVVPSHILQHKGESYYDDVRSWLKGGTSPNGKSYDSDYYAKGGPIKRGSGARMSIDFIKETRKVGEFVRVETDTKSLWRGKELKGEIVSLKPFKIRTGPTSTSVIPDKLIKSVKSYAKGGRVYEISDIEYDTDDDSDLPKTLKIEVPSGYEGYEADEFISDKISDETGFTHLGYSTNPEIKYAKGGEVKKKGNEMLIGGLAGMLIGIFLGKR